MIQSSADGLQLFIDANLIRMFATCGILLVCYVLYRMARSLRRGGGAATIFFVGTTDAFRNTDQRSAAAIVVRQQTGDRLGEEERGGACE